MAEGTPIESLQIQIEATASSAEKSLEDLKKSVELLKSALSGTGLTGLVKELKNVEATTNELGTTSAASIEKLVQALKDLQGVGKLNLDYTAKELDTVNKASERAVSSTTGWGKRIIAAAVSLKTIGHTIASFIDKSNAYVENLNLFNVSLGEYAESAKQYAEQVGTLMGIDPSAWMRNQGVFQILATGFGVASDRAYIMSKNLTQLGYDLSSFFNIAVEGEGGAMQKLQAAISGELEPLRRLGFDLSEARLKAVALSLGIDQTFNSMTQAQKAQLRYYTILNQVTEAQGDMARTLETPANQLRILKAQAEQAARSLGNIFIPALNAIIPYVNAAIQAIRMLADIIADFFHFELPTVDYSNIDGATNAVDSLDTALQSAGGSAKKLNELLADWDELNIIQSESGGGGSGGASAYNTDDWSFELPEYNFLKDFVETKVTSIMEKIKPYITWVEDHIKEIMRFAEGIGAAFVGWKLASKLIPDITEAASLLTNLFAVVLEGAIITGTVVLNIDLTTNWLETGNWGSIAGEAIATIAGSSLAAALIRHIIGGEKGAIMADWAAGTVLTVNAGVGLFLALEDIKTKGFNYKNIVKLLEASLEASAGMALIARGIGKAITGRSASLGEMLGFVATAFFFTVGATMNIALNKSVLEGDPEALVEQAGISIAEALGVGVSLGLTTGSVTVGAAAAAIAFSANAVLNFVTALGDVTKNGITDANVMALIANSLGATVGIGALVGILTGSLGWAVVAGVLTLTLAATAFVIVKELTVNADKSMVPHWGTRSLTEQEINDKVNGMFGFDVDATITTINAIVDANAKVNLDTKTASEKLGKELTAWLMDLNSTEALDQIHVSLFGEATEEGELDPNSLLGKFKAELSSAREQAVSWFTTANGAGSEGSVTLLELMNLSDEMIFEGVEAAGQEWGRLFKEGFTDETKDLGMQLLKLIYDVTSAGELGAIQADYEMSVMDFTLADLDEKSIQKLFLKQIRLISI